MVTPDSKAAIIPNPDQAVIERSSDEWFECITQSPDEPSPPEFLAICTVEAELLACSFRCPFECGGHPICRPCFDLANQRGELHWKDARHD